MIKAKGLIQAYIGGKLVKEEENTIDDGFFQAMARVLGDDGLSPTRFALDNLFSTAENPPDDTEDGIVLYDSSLNPNASQYWSMATVLSSPASNQFRATGTLTTGGTSKTFTQPQLGNNWVSFVDPYDGIVDWEEFTNFALAYSNSFSVAVPASETLTLVWTITFTAH